MTAITDLINKKVMHGSPGYETEEVIECVSFSKHGVEIDFESKVFTRLSFYEFETFLEDEELIYHDQTHGGITSLLTRALALSER